MVNKVADKVNSPAHYTSGGIEAYEVLRAKLTPEEWRGYLKGNILKYMLRANFKGEHDTDINKAGWYADKLKELVNNDGNQHRTEHIDEPGNYPGNKNATIEKPDVYSEAGLQDPYVYQPRWGNRKVPSYKEGDSPNPSTSKDWAWEC